MRDVIKLPKNRLGRDFVIGDVHGAARAFAEVLKKLGPNDRLFIVGDLIDRGEDSAAIIKFIRQQNAGKVPPQIYVTKGNHEVFFLNAVAFLYSENPEYVFHSNDSTKNSLLNFLANGGEWIYERPDVQTEIRGLIADVRRRFISPEALLRYLKYRTVRSDLGEFTTFIQDLPYAIQVGELGDPRSFVVCHSDMPLGDAQLAAIANGIGELSEKQKYHMLWARPEGVGNSDEPVILKASQDVRTDTAMVDYSGHNAMYDETTRIVRHIKTTNDETNTVNLDFGAHRNGFVVVNHTDQTVEVVTAPGKVASDFLINAARDIARYLKAQFSKRLLLADRAVLDEEDQILFDQPALCVAQSKAEELAAAPSIPHPTTSDSDSPLTDLIDNRLAIHGNETVFVTAIKDALARCEAEQKAVVGRAIFHSVQTGKIAQLMMQLNASTPGSAREFESAKAVAKAILCDGMVCCKAEKFFGIVVKTFEIECVMKAFQERGWLSTVREIEKGECFEFERFGVTSQTKSSALTQRAAPAVLPS